MPAPSDSPQFDAERADAYDDRIRRLAPGYDALHTAVASLLATTLNKRAHLLVVGAGTGAESVEMGRSHPQWQFTAVDPSPNMLERGREAVAAAGMTDRVAFVCDRVEDIAPTRAFDAATSIFVAHFIQDEASRQQFYRAIAQRVQPGAPFVLADLFRGGTADWHRFRSAWRRSVARAEGSTDEVDALFARIREQIAFMSEKTLMQMLNTAGFVGPSRFFQWMLWGGWVMTKSERGRA